MSRLIDMHSYLQSRKSDVQTQIYEVTDKAFIKEMLTSSCVVPCQSLFAIAIIYAPLVGLKRKVKSKYQQWENKCYIRNTSTTEEDRGSSPQSLYCCYSLLSINYCAVFQWGLQFFCRPVQRAVIQTIWQDFIRLWQLLELLLSLLLVLWVFIRVPPQGQPSVPKQGGRKRWWLLSKTRLKYLAVMTLRVLFHPVFLWTTKGHFVSLSPIAIFFTFSLIEVFVLFCCFNILLLLNACYYLNIKTTLKIFIISYQILDTIYSLAITKKSRDVQETMQHVLQCYGL